MSYVPCSRCGGSPDIHNTNRGRDFVGHEYEVTTDLYPGTDSIESPEEGDYTSSDGGRTWWQYGHLVFSTREGDSAAMLRAHADKNQFWPSAWMISDHGNEHPFSYRS